MASAAAARIRAELLGSQLTTDDILSRLERVSELRAQEYSATKGQSPSGVSITQSNIAGLAVECIQSSRVDVPETTVLFFHGGGFVGGSCATHRNLASRLAISSRSRVVVPEYRLAPEHRFPAPVQDAIAVYQELIRDGTDPRKLVTAGDSAGGGICAALLLGIRDCGNQMPAAAVLVSPWTDLTLSGDSYRTRANLQPVAPIPVLRRLAELYLGDSDPALPLASPIFADLRGLPKTLIQVGDHEVMLDDSRRFFQEAKQKGVEVRMEVWPEMWHGWIMSAPELPEANEAIRRIGAFVRKVTSEQGEARERSAHEAEEEPGRDDGLQSYEPQVF